MAIYVRHEENGPLSALKIPAIQGRSAYEVACDNGFEGTVDDWLQSLQGGGSASIDDSTISTETTWSSSKIEDFVLTNIGAIWQEINGGQMVIDSTMDGFLREVEILGNTIQNQDDLSDIQHLGIWNEEKQGYEIEICTSNTSNKNDANYQEFKTTIILPCPLMKIGSKCDRLYWDKSKRRYVVEKYVYETTDSDIQSIATPVINEVDSHVLFAISSFASIVYRSHGTKFLSTDVNLNKDKSFVHGNGNLEYYLPTGLIQKNIQAFRSYLVANKIKIYIRILTPQLIDTDIREELKLPTFINNTYISVTGGIQGSIKAKIPVDGGKVIGVLREENVKLKEANVLQDDLINTTMLVTDEMYRMLEPLLAETLGERSTSKLVNMYVAMVQRGLIKTIDQVPVRYRDSVTELLGTRTSQ